VQLFNGKWLSLQREKRSYVNGFPLRCCDCNICLFFSKNHVFPEFLTWFKYIFLTHARAALQWKATVPATRNKVLCRWLSIRLLWLQYLSFLLREHVFPGLLTWFKYIFSVHLQLFNGKQLFLQQKKVLCQWLSIRVLWLQYLSFLLREHVFPGLLTWLKYIFSMHLQLFNDKQLSLQQETRSYVSGFPLGCCDCNI
jgi:hypothetical protein